MEWCAIVDSAGVVKVATKRRSDDISEVFQSQFAASVASQTDIGNVAHSTFANVLPFALGRQKAVDSRLMELQDLKDEAQKRFLVVGKKDDPKQQGSSQNSRFEENQDEKKTRAAELVLIDGKRDTLTELLATIKT